MLKAIYMHATTQRYEIKITKNTLKYIQRSNCAVESDRSLKGVCHSPHALVAFKEITRRNKLHNINNIN